MAYMHKNRKTIDIETRRASIEHECTYCDRPIEKGQYYVRIPLVEYRDEEEIFLTIKFHKDKEDCNAKR